MKNLFYNNILIVVFTFLFLGALSLVPFKFDALDPISKAFSDFDLTDLVFSRMLADQEGEDKDIVLVNIGETTRAEFAQMIDTLNKYEPHIIAIDAFYRGLKAPEDSTLSINTGDSLLASALNNVKNLVMVSQLNKYNEKKKRFDTLETSNALFSKRAQYGYANLTTTSQGNMTEFTTSRSFIPKAKYFDAETKKEKEAIAFAVKIAEIRAPKKAKRFLERNNTTEYINFQGNIGFGESEKPKYMTIDVAQLLNNGFEPSLIKNKIIILGFMGKSFGEKSFADKFYTPLNKNYVGKSTPDMYGVIVHANIVSMILQEKYIDELSDWLNIAIMVFASFLSISLFSYFFRNLGYWYDAITVVFQFLISFALFTATVFAFLWFRLKIDTSLAIGAVVLSGLIVEIYYGLIYKLLNKFFVRKREE